MGEGLGDGGGASQQRERAERDKKLINVRVQFPNRDRLSRMIFGHGIIESNPQALVLIDRIGGQLLSAEQFVDIWIDVFNGNQRQDLNNIMGLFELSQPFQQEVLKILAQKSPDSYQYTR